jgi:hypothetical protein
VTVKGMGSGLDLISLLNKNSNSLCGATLAKKNSGRSQTFTLIIQMKLLKRRFSMIDLFGG